MKKKIFRKHKFLFILMSCVLFFTALVKPIKGEEMISPTGASIQDGVSFNVSIAKSLNGSRPADEAFIGNDSIDLANVTRFDMFYTYLKIDYANNSGADLMNTSITLQLPKLGEAGYYEPITPSTAPVGWITYPNTPTGDGNSNFPATNVTTNVTTRLMTWAGATIADGSTGTIYIKIPMRDPYTAFGIVNYTPILNYSRNGVASTISETAQFNIAGQNDKPTFSVSKVNDLGFVPTEPDADQYFYVKYGLTTPYTVTYLLPNRSYEFDRFLTSARINLTIPNGAEVVRANPGTTNTPGIISASAGAQTFVLRYLKTDFPDPNQNISMYGIFNGRFIGDALTTHDISGTEYTLTHPIGTGSIIPSASLGKITISSQNLPISEDALKVSSVPFSTGGVTIARSLDTIVGDELTYEFNGLEYLKGGIPQPTDYAINLIYLTSVVWSGDLDPNKPSSGKITVYYDDGQFEDVVVFSASDFNAGSIGYRGNVPGVIGGFQPPVGKAVKRVIFSFNNVPQGFRFGAYVNGYLKEYPVGGADSLRFNRITNLYGRDTGSGRPHAIGSGDTSYTVSITKNTSFQPQVTMVRTSTGTVNPGNTDILKLQSFFSNKATQSFVNPEFDVLLPAGYTFDGYVDQTNETYVSNLNVFNLPDGRLKDTPPVIEQIPNYNGTGRTLVRIQYKGILQNDERMGGLLTIRAAQYMSPGNYTIEGYFAAENIGTMNNLSNMYTPYTVDVNDMNGNGFINDYIFGSVNTTLNISRGVGTSLYSQVKGSYDPSFTGQGTTKQNTVVEGALTLEYNGSAPMNNVQLLSILPHEGDGTTLYGEVEDGQRVLLASPVDVSAYPGAIVYYNNTPTNDPNATGWTTTYSNTVQSLRVVLDPTFALISGAIEKVSIPLKLQMPKTTDPTQLANVQGIGYLPIKLYSNTNVAGLDGASSTITSLALGIHVKVFQDDNANGIKEGNESWASNVAVDILRLSDDPATATPLYSGSTNDNGSISFIDTFHGIDFALQGYRVVVHTPNGNYNFVSGVGDVTTDTNGYQGFVFNTSNQIVNVTSAFSPKTMSIQGNYWQDYEAVPNGIKDAHDLLGNIVGRTVRLFNVTNGVYESVTTTIQADGSYTLPNVVVGPEYRVEFAYNSTNEVPSIIADNVVTKYANNILGYTFDSNGMEQDDVETIDVAIIQNGMIHIKFSVDGITTIGTSTLLTRGLPSTYTANIGVIQDTTNQMSGWFVVPKGYRLLASEPTSKEVTIDNTTKNQDIVFLVELLKPNLSGVKTSTPATPNLHPTDEITYTLTINNTGNEEALDTIIQDKVPAHTELVSIGDGGVMDANGVITWNIPTIAADTGSVSVSFTVKTVAIQDSGRWNVVNDQATFNGVAMNTTTNEVTQGLLTFEKLSSIPNLKELLPGSKIDYTIKISNVGFDVMENILVKDSIPANTSYVEASMSEGGVKDANGFSFMVASLAPGESIEVGFSVTINDDAKKGSKIENTAKVNSVDTNTITHYVGAKEEKYYENSDTDDKDWMIEPIHTSAIVPNANNSINVLLSLFLLIISGLLLARLLYKRNLERK